MVSKKVPVEEDETLGIGVFQRERLLAFLRSLREEADPEEDARALAELMQALDENRPEGQKLFSDQ